MFHCINNHLQPYHFSFRSNISLLATEHTLVPCFVGSPAILYIDVFTDSVTPMSYTLLVEELELFNLRWAWGLVSCMLIVYVKMGRQFVYLHCMVSVIYILFSVSKYYNTTISLAQPQVCLQWVINNLTSNLKHSLTPDDINVAK